MPKSHLIEKYRKLVLQEEKRIGAETRKRFARLRNVDTHPSLIIGGKYKRHTHSKESYNYLRQRYYRLKRIDSKQIYQATQDYAFDSWYAVIEDFIDHFGMQHEQQTSELRQAISSMTDRDKKMFVSIGYNYALRSEYQGMADDVQKAQTLTLNHLIFRVNSAKEMAR